MVDRNHFVELGLNGRITLYWSLRKYGVRMWSGFKWPTEPILWLL
jgi:hypothetical protein